MKKYLCVLMAMLLSLSLFVACQPSGSQQNGNSPSLGASGSAGTATPPAEENAPVKEQRIVYAMASEPPIMDPGMNYYLSPSNILQNVFRGLFKLDINGNTIPCIATEYTLDDSQTVYTFILRQDAKWNNGNPINAYDFEYSWNRGFAPAVGSSAAYALYNIKNAAACAAGELPMDEVGIKVIDDYTLEVTLEAPTAWFLDLLTTPNFMPVCKDVAETEGWSTNASTYICNGPFMISEMKPKEKYVLVKNPNYFDAANVKLETIEVIFMESAESTLIAYNNGDVDFTENISPEAIAQYTGTDEYVASPKIGLTFYDFNCNKAPFDDARVRKAFAMAINRQEILDYIMESPEKPAYAYVPVGYYDPADKEKLYRDVVGYNLFEEDVAAAQALLAEAGYPGGEGIPQIDLVVGATQMAKDTAQAMQSMWKENLGVTVEIVTYESKIMSEQANLGNFSIIADGWTGLYPDPMSIMQPQASDAGSGTWSSWMNEEFDSLLTSSISELDQQKRMDAFIRMEQILIDEMPVMPVFYRSNLYLCKPHVKNVIKNLVAHTYLEYAYVD